MQRKLKKKEVFLGGQKIKSLPIGERLDKAAHLMPILRGLCSSEKRMIGHFSDSDVVMDYININQLERLAKHLT